MEAFSGPGHHLIRHILFGEEEYTDMMKHGPRVEVAGLLTLFQELGIDPLFTERDGA